MHIKNTFQLLFIAVVSIINIHAMEMPKNSFFDKKRIYTAFVQTPEYQNYDRAKKLHEKHNTPETEALLEEAAGHLLETQESEELLCAVETQKTEPDPIAVYSENTIIKYNIMKTSAAYQQHEDAKIEHQKYNTTNTLYMVDLCKEELHSSKECRDFLRAMEQDKIAQSHKKQNSHTNHYNSFSLSAEQQSAKRDENNAWQLVIQTPEYKLFQDAKREHKIHNTEKTRALFEMRKNDAVRTPEYKHYISTSSGPSRSAERDAWDLVTQTRECQLFQYAKRQHEIHNTPKTEAFARKCCSDIKKTAEYQCYAYIATRPPIGPIIIRHNICLNYLNEQNNPDQQPIEIILKK